ncbi:MAG: 4-(cytidine 5'-diphospho)-2-C-methyl-D-erythritol kinase [Terriglobia bacterium]
MRSPSIRLRAFAKINAGLKILGKRRDGYHEIRTIYQAVALHDELTISVSRTQGIDLRCSDPRLPASRDNLVYRACELWKKERNFSGGVRLDLKKIIPSGAGLGGGSSDAAATLMGLERLARRQLDPIGLAALFRLAATLGSDVAFFLLGGRALGCGRGEEVYPLTDLPRRPCLIAHPGFEISTADAYRAAGRLTARVKNRKNSEFGVWSQFPFEHWGPAENDFEQAVFAKWPELGRIKAQFIRAGAETASLTGSGSAIYAIFVSARQLERALDAIPKAWSVYRTHTLGRAAYRRLLIQ